MSKRLNIYLSLMQAHFMQVPAKAGTRLSASSHQKDFPSQDWWQVPIVKSSLLELNLKVRLLLLEDGTQRGYLARDVATRNTTLLAIDCVLVIIFLNLCTGWSSRQRITRKGNRYGIIALVLVRSLCSDLLRETEKGWLKCINSAEQ